jgi:hypothetical protein
MQKKLKKDKCCTCGGGGWRVAWRIPPAATQISSARWGGSSGPHARCRCDHEEAMVARGSTTPPQAKPAPSRRSEALP